MNSDIMHQLKETYGNVSYDADNEFYSVIVSISWPKQSEDVGFGQDEIDFGRFRIIVHIRVTDSLNENKIYVLPLEPKLFNDAIFGHPHVPAKWADRYQRRQRRGEPCIEFDRQPLGPIPSIDSKIIEESNKIILFSYPCFGQNAWVYRSDDVVEIINATVTMLTTRNCYVFGVIGQACCKCKTFMKNVVKCTQCNAVFCDKHISGHTCYFRTHMFRHWL